MARVPFTVDQALAALKAAGSAEDVAGMARFGIKPHQAYGVRMPVIRDLAKQIAYNHELAEQLWQSRIHEARILATLVDRPKWVDLQQMLRWAGEFGSWDICDQACGNLFDKTADVELFISTAVSDSREFVRRAGFATIAWRAVHDKKADDAVFLPYLALIQAQAGDNRNFVKKAVNWALRQIGKRSWQLHGPALALAQNLAALDDPAARWIGSDAAKELSAGKLVERLQAKAVL